jgi:hypothetical protein
MEPARKVTVEISERLLRSAQKTTGKGITATIREGLQLIAASRAYDELRKMRGKVTFSVDLTELREDRT